MATQTATSVDDDITTRWSARQSATMELNNLTSVYGVAPIEGSRGPSFLVTGGKRYGVVVTASSEDVGLYPCLGAWAVRDVVSKGDRLYTVDSMTDSVHVMDRSGLKVKEIPLGCKHETNEEWIYRITGRGRLYVSVPDKRMILMCPADGNTFSSHITYESPDGPTSPAYMCVTGDEQLIVGDLDTPVLYIHQAGGRLTGTHTMKCESVWGLSCDGDETVFVAHQNPNGISVFSMKEESLTATTLISLTFEPRGLCVTEDAQHLVVGQYDEGRVNLYTLDDKQRNVMNKVESVGPEPFLGNLVHPSKKLTFSKSKAKVTLVKNLEIPSYDLVSGVTYVGTKFLVLTGNQAMGRTVNLADYSQTDYPCDKSAMLYDVTSQDGELFFTDRGTNCVHVSDGMGQTLRTIKLPLEKKKNKMYCFLTVAVTKNIFASLDDRRSVYVCRPGSQTFTLFTHYDHYTGLGGVAPGYLCCTKEGYVVVGDTDSGRILVHDQEGTLLWQCWLGCFGVWGVSSDGRGRLYVGHDMPHGVSVVWLEEQRYQRLMNLDYRPHCVAVLDDGRHMAVGHYDEPQISMYKIKW